VPAPATATLLVGVPVVPGASRQDGSSPGELTTPTGAALLKALGSGFGPCPALVPLIVGYGAGTRDIGSPNVCRLIVGESSARDIELEREGATLIETNVDHISPEAAAFAAEQLLAEGALDVWQAPVVMKKGRAGFVLSVLVEPTTAEHFAARAVALTGTLGARVTEVPRLVAARETRTLETAWGPVRFKIGPKGASPRVRPEHDDVARIAREAGRTYRDVAEELVALLHESDALA